MRHRLLALVLAVAVSVPASAFAHVAQICRFSGVSCCCSHQAKRAKCDGVAIDRDSCCQSKLSQFDKASAAFQTSFDVPAAALIERMPIPTAADRASGQGADLVERARGPPGNGPPLFIRDCRLLS